MHEGIILVIVFGIMFLLGAGIFAGLYWWYYKKKHTTGNGHHFPPPQNCGCHPSERKNATPPDWSSKIQDVCHENKMTPECMQRQKIVCEESGACFDSNVNQNIPWCYKC